MIKLYASFLIVFITSLSIFSCSDNSVDPIQEPPEKLDQLQTIKGYGLPNAFVHHDLTHNVTDTIFYEPVPVDMALSYLPDEISQNINSSYLKTFPMNYFYSSAFIYKAKVKPADTKIYNVQYYFGDENPKNPFECKNLLVINIQNAISCMMRTSLEGDQGFFEIKTYKEKLGEHSFMYDLPDMENYSVAKKPPMLFHSIKPENAYMPSRSGMYFYDGPNNKFYGLFMIAYHGSWIEISYNGLFYSFQYWSENDDDEDFHLQMREFAKKFVLGSN